MARFIFLFRGFQKEKIKKKRSRKTLFYNHLRININSLKTAFYKDLTGFYILQNFGNLRQINIIKYN